MTSVGEFGAPQQISTSFASWLRYCSSVAHWRPTKLCVVLSRLLGWYAVYIYIFGCACPLAEFCQLQNSLYIQVLHSPVLAVWLHGTRATAVSQTLWRGMRNGITELSQRATPIFGWAAITLGIGPHSSVTLFYCKLEVLSHLHQINRSSCWHWHWPT